MAENDSGSEDLLKFKGKPTGSQVKSEETPKSKKSFFSFLKPQKKKEKTEGKDTRANAVFNSKLLSRILLALTLAAAVYLIFDLFVFKFDESEFLGSVGTNEAVYPFFDQEGLKKGQNVEYYLKPIEQRNPFLSPSAMPLEEEQEAKLRLPKSQTQQMAGIVDGLKVVGISWADEPVAMIEDEGTNRTYFARKGQIIRGAKVASITDEKVTLTYEGEEAYLT